MQYSFDDPETLIVAIGDIHGRVDLAQRLVPKLDHLATQTPRRIVEVYLGDYVDRGGNPCAVIDFLMSRAQRTDRRVICLAGNHEHMMLDALDDVERFRSWIDFGGNVTAMSYGVSPEEARRHPAKLREKLLSAIPPAHIEFLRGLPTYLEHGGFLFVHAGIRPGIPLEKQTTRDLLWVRDEFMKSTEDFGFVVVHGHTVVPQPVFRRNRISIDTGAYATGILSCVVVTSDTVTMMDTNLS